MQHNDSRVVHKRRFIALGAVPLVALTMILVAFLVGGSAILVPLGISNIPFEKIDIERIQLEQGRVFVYAVNSGPREATIAQVFVNDAIWHAGISPSSTVPRLGRVTLSIPYHWVEGEPLEISIVTSNGFVFSKGVDVAVQSPVPSVAQVGAFAALGTYVGIIPVFLGLTWLPFLSQLKTRWYNFLLAFTTGILVFLAVDSLSEAFDLSTRVPEPFQGIALVAIGLVGSFLALEMVSERMLNAGASTNRARLTLTLAYMIALGIGLHNLGEGLLIGAAYALGEATLGAFLIFGFTIHNTTEGVAIAAPLAGRAPARNHFILIGLLAGAPTVLGAWIGGFTYSDVWALVFLAVGVGAILQVVYKILRYMGEGRGMVKVLSESINLTGLLLGTGIMYATALLVA